MQDTEQAQAKEQTTQPTEVLEDIKNQVSSWEDVSTDRCKVKRMGGLSNEIYKVTAPNKNIEPRQVIYRKFGSGSAIVDRERENYVIKGLSDKGLSPKFYGGDEEYRVEKFIESKLLEPSDLHDKATRRRLTKLLTDLHLMDFEKLDKTPCFLRHLEKDGDFMKSFKEKAGNSELSAEDKKKVEKILAATGDEELSFLKEIAPKGESSSVFSHNDLHSQNVIIREGNKYMLIDFEYSEYNFRGFDIANLFNESMIEYDTDEAPHFKVDESKFPKDACLLEFVKYYLFFMKFGKEEFDLDSVLKHDSYRDEYIRKNHDLEAFNKEAGELLCEVKICKLFSHYFWALWGVIMGKNGSAEFDYIEFANARFELYQKAKKELEEKGCPNPASDDLVAV